MKHILQPKEILTDLILLSLQVGAHLNHSWNIPLNAIPPPLPQTK